MRHVSDVVARERSQVFAAHGDTKTVKAANKTLRDLPGVEVMNGNDKNASTVRVRIEYARNRVTTFDWRSEVPDNSNQPDHFSAPGESTLVMSA